MFNNKFNSSKSDPLVEAVKQAQHDGDLRRQAEAYVNEEFGVYSRQAVVREHLAAYDAAIEEAYKCMKEGGQIDEISKKLIKRYEKIAGRQTDKDYRETTGWGVRNKKKEDRIERRERGAELASKRMEKIEAGEKADKDYDKDGKIESPKDEVWGSRLRAAKLAGKLKEGAMDSDVVGGGSVTKDNKPVVSQTAPKADTSGPSAADKAGLASKIKAMNEAIARKRDIAKGGVTAPIEYADKMGFANPGAISKLDEAWNKLKEARKCMEEESDTFDFSHLDEAYANYIAEAINEYGLQEEHPVVTVENIHMFNESYIAAVLDEAAECEYEKSEKHEKKAKEHKEKMKELDEARMRAEKECNEEELDEAKKWIQSAIKRPGSLSKKLGVPEEKNIPASKLEVKKGDTAATKKQKVLAKTLKHLARKKKMEEELQIDEAPMTSTASTFKPSVPGQQAAVQSRTTKKGWADPGAYENQARSQTGSMQQIRGGKVLPPSSQLGTPKSMDTAPKPATTTQTPQQRWDASRAETGVSSTTAKAQTTAVQSQPSDQKSTSDFMKSQGIGVPSTPTPAPAPEQSKAATGTFAASKAAGDDQGQASKNIQKLMKMDESVQVGDKSYRIV